MIAWIDGRLAETEGALDAADRGFTLGDGLFETLATVDGQPLRLPAHLSRFRAGAEVLGIPVPYSDAAIAAAVGAVLQATNVTEGAVRITMSRGVGARGVLPPERPTPTVVVTAAAMPVGATDPVRLIVAETTRRNDRSPLAGVKSLNYLDAVLARREAAAKGADDAVLLNTQDRVAETTIANVFAVIGGDVVTPPLTDGVLAGTMRARVIAAAQAHERSLSPSDLESASEIILTSALSVRPAVMLNGKPVGDGRPGPVAAGLASLPRRP